MAVGLVIGVTDDDWFNQLRLLPNLQEVNFWSPSDKPFKALQPGELFLFKLHSPNNYIVGGGVFAHANSMPCSLAWEAFGRSNGANSLAEMRTRILKYRSQKPDDRVDFLIGCRILTQPFFLSRENWIPVPANFSRNIVSIKKYSTGDSEGQELWKAVQQHSLSNGFELHGGFSDGNQAKYGEPILVRPRLGQGAFRVMVTDNYARKCAISGERTLPALDAAHIRPFSEGGSHDPSNGVLLRRDIHSLFDLGYVTITPDFRFQVSRRIREEYENGKHYYALNGGEISVPSITRRQPDLASLRWHNEYRFKG
jgi:putative restriction endonuclease